MAAVNSFVLAVVTATVLMGVLAEAGEPARAWPVLPPLPAGPFVALTDGGIRAGDLMAIDDDAVTIDAPATGMVRLPRSTVAGYRASTAVAPGRGRAAAGTALITFTNGDAVEAQSVAVADGQIHFTADRGSSPAFAAPVARVLAIDFAVPAAAAGPRMWAAWEDGSRFASAADPPAQADGVVATVSEGDAVRFLTSLAAEPAAAVHPLWPTARGSTAFTACGMHAPARVRFRLDRPAARFRGRVAIDDSAGQGGSVVVTVRSKAAGDAFHDVFKSPVIRGGDDPLAVDADLGGGRELELAIEPADVGTVLDRTIWLDARVEFE